MMSSRYCQLLLPDLLGLLHRAAIRLPVARRNFGLALLLAYFRLDRGGVGSPVAVVRLVVLRRAGQKRLGIATDGGAG